MNVFLCSRALSLCLLNCYLRLHPQPHPQPNTRRSPLHRLQFRSQSRSRASRPSFSRSHLSSRRSAFLLHPQPQPHLRRGSSRVAVTGQEHPQPVLDLVFILSCKVSKSLSNPQHIFFISSLIYTCGGPPHFQYMRDMHFGSCSILLHKTESVCHGIPPTRPIRWVSHLPWLGGLNRTRFIPMEPRSGSSHGRLK